LPVDLLIPLLPGAGATDKAAPAPTAAQSGDAFGQMLRNVQTTVSMPSSLPSVPDNSSGSPALTLPGLPIPVPNAAGGRLVPASAAMAIATSDGKFANLETPGPASIGAGSLLPSDQVASGGQSIPQTSAASWSDLGAPACSVPDEASLAAAGISSAKFNSPAMADRVALPEALAERLTIGKTPAGGPAPAATPASSKNLKATATQGDGAIRKATTADQRSPAATELPLPDVTAIIPLAVDVAATMGPINSPAVDGSVADQSGRIATAMQAGSAVVGETGQTKEPPISEVDRNGADRSGYPAPDGITALTGSDQDRIANLLAPVQHDFPAGVGADGSAGIAVEKVLAPTAGAIETVTAGNPSPAQKSVAGGTGQMANAAAPQVEPSGRNAMATESVADRPARSAEPPRTMAAPFSISTEKTAPSPAIADQPASPSSDGAMWSVPVTTVAPPQDPPPVAMVLPQISSNRIEPSVNNEPDLLPPTEMPMARTSFRAATRSNNASWLPAIETVMSGTSGSTSAPGPVVAANLQPAGSAAAALQPNSPLATQNAPVQVRSGDSGGAAGVNAERRAGFRFNTQETDPVLPASLSGSELKPEFQVGAAPVAPAVTSTVSPPADTVPEARNTGMEEPVEQVTPVLLKLAKSSDGGQETTIRMQPAELGVVQVKITRAESGATQIDITAEKSSTLVTLQRDQMQLHRTLDEAGVSAVGRIVTFHTAPAAQLASGGSNMNFDGSPPSGHQGQNNRSSSNTGDTDGSTGGDRGNSSEREANGYPSGRRPAILPEIAATASGRSYRSGLDITA
jgi:flagellar hook-length control protein FliK